MEANKKCCPEEILGRLRKIEGQVRGVIRMIEDQRRCEDILVQVAAIRAAINQVGAQMLVVRFTTCLEEAQVTDELIKQAVEEFAPLLRKWS
jgi:DNA-binding FrmR family transcriptional regulator